MRFSKVLKIFCCTLAALYLLGGTLLFLFQRHLIFAGKNMARDNSAYNEIKSFARTFDINGEKLQGWLINRPRTPLVVYFGGNGEDAAWAFKNFLAWKNVSCLAVNYRGYGHSTGSPGEENLINDGISLIENILKETDRSYNQVIIVGQSLGSGVAVGAASKLPPVGKLVLLVPFDNLYSIAAEQMPFYPVSLLIRDKFPSDERIKSLKSPVSIISAEKDTVIPVQHARRLAKLTPTLTKYTELPGVGHNDLKSSPHYAAVFRREVQLPGQEMPVIKKDPPPTAPNQTSVKSKPAPSRPAANKRPVPAKRPAQGKQQHPRKHTS